MRLLAALALLIAVFVVAGAFGPWMHFEDAGGNTGTQRGVQTDGAVVVIAGVVAIVAFAVALARPGNYRAALIGLIAVAASALVGAYSWMIFDQAIPAYEGTGRITHAETGWGLPVSTAAGVAATLVAVAHLRRVENS